MDTYLVGGAVRDKLLGIAVKDRDWVVVGAQPQELEQLGFRTVGSDFPVFLHPDTGEEYALARTERKNGHGYGGFIFHTDASVTLEQDLSRRDLTINAIAQDSNGQLVDPYGGQQDIAERKLRHVSAAFIEDPLRVLRVARFAARFHHLGFSIAAETLALMKDITDSGELQYLSPERVWSETLKALSEGSPRTYLQVLRECGALAVLFPELEKLFGVPQRADFHPEVDTGIHLLMAMDQATQLSNDPRVRFAVMMHDLGKGITPEHILPRHMGHEEAGVPLVEAFCERLRVPNRFRKLAIVVTRYHLLCHKIDTLRPATVLKVLKGLDVFRQPESLHCFLLACTADARGRTGFEEVNYPSAQWLQNLANKVTTITSAEFVNAGLKGPAIGAAIDKKRLEYISDYKLEHKRDLETENA
ncbi:multifunctional CCA tRNA nucleotidyl transferase/2'3'-cyclic phosphodiesterase/2'nucleotidase/phosphatase [Gammaproteobacteria bacterium 54_18_T64]|nr:multifunctional CCA tRNA nucleotidyl transferase/2'3'-cyclic phosphodiesterase/2'nucleotidase/phosphatase [Gammaproteobacteria bacterium 54_18_T64]